MLEFVARLCEPLLRLLAPAPGRRRATEALGQALPDAYGPVPAVSGPLNVVTPPSDPGVFLRGEDTRLVRPYFVAHARRQVRRRALWVAVHGVDLRPRGVRDIEVAA